MRQEYDKYTAEDQKVWSLLFNRQMEVLPGRADDAFFDGLRMIKFSAGNIPVFTETNQHLSAITGWEIEVVAGLIPDRDFFELLASCRFPCSTWLRTLEQLNYLQEPDMFHDVFGHVPLLTNQAYCDFLSGLAVIALKHIENPWAIELLSRIYWFTIEFGVIQSDNGLRIYGAGIMSSPGESEFSLQHKVPNYPFDVAHIFSTPYIKSKYQERYFVIQGYEQLYKSLDKIEEVLPQFINNQEKKAEWESTLETV